jgi:predicted transcriptional regulator
MDLTSLLFGLLWCFSEVFEAHMTDIKALAASVVTAYLTGNKLASDDVPKLVQRVHDTLRELDGAQIVTADPPNMKPTPAVAPTKSVFRDYIICLEDGKRHRTMRRHLNSAHGLTPEQYRLRWDLPGNYPMIAPSYAQKRSEMAKSMGLGSTIEKRSTTNPVAKRAVRKEGAKRPYHRRVT